MTLNKQNKDYYKEIIKHAESNPSEEVCGTISLDSNLIVTVTKEKNQSFDKQKMFEISPLRILGQKKLLGIYHSHPRSSENPSQADINNSEELGIPFLIYSLVTKKIFLYIPDSFEPSSLIGRPYVRGFCECVNIPRDYYSQRCPWFKLDYRSFNYFPDIDGKKANIYMLKIFEEGFIKIKDKEDIRKHDMKMYYM
jgi:proteasome lid subunit RPN8/RPN11